MRINSLALPVLLVTALAGCFENGAPAQRGDERSREPAVPSSDKRFSGPGVELPDSHIAPAVQDLAERSGASMSEIRVVRAVPVKWNDGSRGCPQPGVAYTMAITAGFWVVLEKDGVLYSYHAGSGPNYSLCRDAEIDPDGNPPHGRLNEDV